MYVTSVRNVKTWDSYFPGAQNLSEHIYKNNPKYKIGGYLLLYQRHEEVLCKIKFDCGVWESLIKATTFELGLREFQQTQMGVGWFLCTK